jgi:hypothetical protein
MRVLVFLAISLVLFLLLAANPAAAQTPSMFSVTGVHVDATGASSTEAQNKAIADGRPKAWEILYRRLTRQQDWGKIPKLDTDALLRLSRGFSVANERRSTTRYVADITYSFNPDAVERVLRDSAIAYTQSQARRILVVPMSPTFSRGPWAAALASPRFNDGAVPFTVPSGDATDMAALGGLNFETANWRDVEPVASRIRATEAVLVLAQPQGNKMVVTIRRLAANALPQKSTPVEIPLLQAAAATYPSAADVAVRAIEDMWKNRSAVDFSRTGKLNADIRISSFSQWGNIQNQLAAVPNVTGVTLIAMSTNVARVTLSYLGTTDQLRDALAQSGVSLTGRGNEWVIASAGQ